MNYYALQVAGVTKSFDGIKALYECSFNLNKGEILGIIGSNGSGKTTLFNIITGFLKGDSGRIFLYGKDITGIEPHEISNIGIIRTFQNLRIIRQISVMDNVLLAFKDKDDDLKNVFFRWGDVRKNQDKNTKKAIQLLKDLNLDSKINDLAENLSYGQQKLLTIACCLVTDSQVYLFDEPISGVSPIMIEKVINIIKNIKDHGRSVIVIEHNIEFVEKISDRVIFMDAGEMISQGTPEEVRNDPRVIEAYIK